MHTLAALLCEVDFIFNIMSLSTLWNLIIEPGLAHSVNQVSKMVVNTSKMPKY